MNFLKSPDGAWSMCTEVEEDDISCSQELGLTSGLTADHNSGSVADLTVSSTPDLTSGI